MNYVLLRFLAIGTVGSAIALAHYTWIAPMPSLLEVGKETMIQVGHGHAFPESEEAINASQLDLFVLGPSGKRASLHPAALGPMVNAKFTPGEPGFYRIAFVQDRGISSRTPAGVKKGGRDKNPNAIQASRTLRTAIAYAKTANAAIDSKPLGLEFEMIGVSAKGEWSLQVLKQGKPVSGVPIEVSLPGKDKAIDAGKTGPDGRVSFRYAPGTKGPAMFSAAYKDTTPGANFDFTSYETSLYVSW